jgi:hypothetical protein
MNGPLNLDIHSTREPIDKLVLTVIKDGIALGADGILLELDFDLHLKVQKESEVIREKYRRPTFYEAIFKKRYKDFFCYGKSMVEKMFFELGQLPMALKVAYSINGIQQLTPPVRGELFADIIETIKPVSKWMLESEDLTRHVRLRRIRC